MWMFKLSNEKAESVCNLKWPLGKQVGINLTAGELAKLPSVLLHSLDLVT